MLSRAKKYFNFCFIILLSTCLILFYIALTNFSLNKWVPDFIYFYWASKESLLGLSPYASDWSAPAKINLILQQNPNPPLLFLLFSILSFFKIKTAFLTWLLVSSSLGLYGIYKCCACIFPAKDVFPKFNIVCCLCLLSFPVILNFLLGQLGGVLLFLALMGYYAYLKKKEGWSAFWWGLLIALKLFPGLLFIYVLLKRQYRLFTKILISFLVWSLIPILVFGGSIYSTYFHKLLQGFNIYGLGWNASLLGFLFRIFAKVEMNPAHLSINLSNPNILSWIYGVYLLTFLLVLIIWMSYFKRIDQRGKHSNFALSLILMLLLSPLGWNYYFPLLLLPLIYSFYNSLNNSKSLGLWFITLFLLSFPKDYSSQFSDPKGLINSLYFYALLALSYLILTPPQREPTGSFSSRHLIGVFAAVIFGSLPVLWAVL